MASSVRTVTKALAAEEDLLFGEGTAKQTRADIAYTVTKIRGFRPVNSSTELSELDFNKFPKAVLVESGLLRFYQHNGTNYEEVTLINKTLTVTSPVTTLSAIANSTILISSGSAHTIASIDNGTKGQEITIITTTANTTIANNASIVLKDGSNYLIPTNTGLKLVYTGLVWAEV